MSSPSPRELRRKWALRELLRDERRKGEALDARRARKLKQLSPWVAPTTEDRAQWSSRYPQKLD